MGDIDYITSIPSVNSTWTYSEDDGGYTDARTLTLITLGLFIVIPLIAAIIFLKKKRRFNFCARCCIRGLASPM